MMLLRWLLLLLLLIVMIDAFPQINKRKQNLFRDTVDNAFDVSNFLIDVNGFIPLPFFITEPALGNFGGGLSLIFIKKRPPLIDTVRSKVKIIRMPPDISGVGGMYTANNSWGTMLFRSGSWLKARMRYRVIVGYCDVNLSYYRTLQNEEDHEFKFNFKITPFSGYLLRQFKGSYWSVGLKYLLLHTEVKPASGTLPEFVDDKEIDSYISMPGVIVDFDNRDNVFTPDKGIRFQASSGWSDGIFGSDYDYVNLTVFAYGYYPISKKVIGALRYEMQEVFEGPPFYLLPYIDMRGIPTARYQGNIFSLIEGEVRWDFVTRWSLVGFAGTAKAYDEWNEFKDSDFITSGGGGLRYLIAKKFKLRMGVDVARGPEQWAYYIVFGSAWHR